MKISAIICVFALVLSGINASVYALFGFDFLMLICFNNTLLYKILHIFFGVAALFCVFWAFVFKPFNDLS